MNAYIFVLSISSILLSVSVIFYLDVKRLNRAILYVVLNFLFILAEIALITSSFLSLNKFQIHNQMTINSIKKYDDTQLLIFLSTKMFNSSQSHIMSIICLFIALSILKFVTIPMTLLTLWTNTHHQQHQHSTPITNNNNHNDNKYNRGRLSEIKYPKPPPRPSANIVSVAEVNQKSENDHHHHSRSRSFTSSMLEGHGDTKRRNTFSEFSAQRYPSLPSETNHRRLSDSEMLYKNIESNKQDSEGLFQLQNK